MYRFYILSALLFFTLNVDARQGKAAGKKSIYSTSHSHNLTTGNINTGNNSPVTVTNTTINNGTVFISGDNTSISPKDKHGNTQAATQNESSGRSYLTNQVKIVEENTEQNTILHVRRGLLLKLWTSESLDSSRKPIFPDGFYRCMHDNGQKIRLETISQNPSLRSITEAYPRFAAEWSGFLQINEAGCYTLIAEVQTEDVISEWSVSLNDNLIMSLKRNYYITPTACVGIANLNKGFIPISIYGCFDRWCQSGTLNFKIRKKGESQEKTLKVRDFFCPAK